MLTASDAAALGCNKYQTPFDLILKKCGLVRSSRTRRRNTVRNEDEAREIFESKYPEVGKVYEFGVVQHLVHKFLGGSSDGVTEISNSLVEIKCPLMRNIGDGQTVPEHYMPQLQLCMDILDLDDGYFVQYKPSEITWPAPRVTVVHVPRDREWMARSSLIFREFWDQVLYYRQNLDELRRRSPCQGSRASRAQTETTVFGGPRSRRGRLLQRLHLIY